VRLPYSGGAPSGHRVRGTEHGLEIIGPKGHRLLHAQAPHPPSDPPVLPDAHEVAGPGGPYDAVLVDVPSGLETLGVLRRSGRVGETTWVVAVGIDHQMPSETELSRRLAMWGVRAVPDGAVLDVATDPPPHAPVPRRALLLGGSRSGKSAEAELRLAAEPAVTYVATGPPGGSDPEWLARIGTHRARRPAHWTTVETTDLAPLLRTAGTPLLVDGLGTWLAAVFDECQAWDGGTGPVEERCAELVAAWRQSGARVVAVSDEVGLGVVPATRSGRMFRDALGRLNQRLVLESEEAVLVVAGRPVGLPI
jgi:adenosylcobinamide kinase/adenosylcobinamide-phosphate guanylyltransferase